MTKPGLDAGGKLALAAVALAGATILGALAFEHLGGYLPCPLCLEQRQPYYVGIWCLMVALLPHHEGKRTKAFVMCALTALVFLKGSYLGAYQAGAEWRWWEGPSDCASAALSGHFDAASLLDKIRQTKLVSCTDPELRILGVSLAGWNAAVSFALAGLCAAAAVANYRNLKDSEWLGRLAARIRSGIAKD